MFTCRLHFALYLFLLICLQNVHSYYVTLTNSGPVVLGGTVTFKAELFNEEGEKPSGTFSFGWQDNAIPQHTSRDHEFEGPETVSVWNATYPADTYGPGMYEVEVKVFKKTILYWPLTSQRAYFNLTNMLSGKIVVHQGNITRNSFVSSVKETNHTIELTKADADYISRNATSILTYWFVDCIYYGQSSDYNFQINYTVPEKNHIVEALVVASYEPITTTTVPTTVPSTNVTTSTTTSTTTNIPASNITTTSSTTTSTTTTATPTTTVAIETTTESHHSGIVSDSTEVLPTNSSVMMPFVCLNTSVIPADPKKTYGYFAKKFKVKAPISKVTIDGTNWLQQGDILKLQVSWTGSPNYSFCQQEYIGIYNITGHERCEYKTRVANNTLDLKHYFSIPGTYTFVIILENDVSKNITQVGINVYEVTKQAQLSVIVVPVACSLLAVILIVFGVAYYIQSRNTYTIEVADFNFGERDNMEYKTFRERLREAFQGHGFTCPDVRKPEELWGPGVSRNNYGRMN